MMNPERTREILTTAIQYLDRGWTQGDDAIDEKGKPVPPRSPEACSWCAIGAISAAMGDPYLKGEHKMVRDAITDTMGLRAYSLAEWNDAPLRTFAEVRTAFEKTLNAI